jgi:predicted metal-dependent peptidase
MRQSPFFASLLFRMPMIVSYEIPTMATDGLVVLWNPVFVDMLRRKDIVFVLLHEVQHVVFKHPMRCPLNVSSLKTLMDLFNRTKQQDPFLKTQIAAMQKVLKKWNFATDHAINLNIRDNVGLKPTEHLMENFKPLMDDKYKEWGAEKIYKDLPDPDENPEDEGKGGVGDVLPVGMGELDKHEQKDAEKELEAAVHAAAVIAKKAGNLPGGMEKVIKDMYTTTTPWQDILRTQIATVASKMDYTYLRPNKRFANHMMDHGVIMPGLIGEEYADMYFVMDTSGSVSDNDKRILASELRRILEDYQVRIHLIYCDTKVHGDPIVLTQEDIKQDGLSLEIKGYGGTDFRPAFRYINEHRDDVDPEMVVYLTDMCPNTWDLGQEPPYNVYWAVLPQGSRDAKPPWGTKIQIELNGDRK